MPWSDELEQLLSHLEGGAAGALLPVILAGAENYPEEFRRGNGDNRFVLPSAIDRRVLFNTLHACYSKHSTDDDVIHIAHHQVREQRINRPLNVLIGDDNATNRLVLERMLDKMGYQCTSVSGGVEVLTALEHSHYDVVVVDKNMPDMGGIDVYNACSMAHGGTAPAKFIILTADATAEARDVCQAAGLEYFLTKPVSMVRLQEMLGRAMSDVEMPVEGAEILNVPLQANVTLPVVDEAEFARLEVLAGDNSDFIRDMVENFDKDAQRDIRCLEAAVAGHAWRDFIDCAHALKGSAMYLGLAQLVALGTEAQKLSKEDFDRYGVAWLQEIREACAAGLQQLQEKLSASRRSGHVPA
jgi:two-component system sensor histidine kinase RpfC